MSDNELNARAELEEIAVLLEEEGIRRNEDETVLEMVRNYITIQRTKAYLAEFRGKAQEMTNYSYTYPPTAAVATCPTCGQKTHLTPRQLDDRIVTVRCWNCGETRNVTTAKLAVVRNG